VSVGGGLAQLGAMLRLVARGLAARGDPGPLPEVPRRKPAVERDAIGFDPRALRRYLRATDGERIAWEKEGETVVPPLYPVTWEAAQTLELLAGLERPLQPGAIVHVEGELLSLRTLTADDRVRCRVELERMEPVRRGVRLTLTARNWLSAGQLCSQSTVVLLARTRAPADEAPRPPREPDPRAEPPEAWEEVAAWRLGADAGRRYARVSGDWNPIHLWSWSARVFGFHRPILHGFCTEAMVAHALIEHRFGGDPAALRRLRIAFRAPLPLPSRVRLQVGERLGQRWFRVTDAAGERVHAEGTYAGGSQLPRPQLQLVT
jgi:acyl dehydratase